MKAAGPGTNRKGHMRPAHPPAASFLPPFIKDRSPFQPPMLMLLLASDRMGRGEATQREGSACVCGKRRALNLSVAMSGLAG